MEEYLSPTQKQGYRQFSCSVSTLKKEKGEISIVYEGLITLREISNDATIIDSYESD